MSGVSNSWLVGDFLLKTDYLREIGGVDCKYKTGSCGMSDFVFRIQNSGGKFHLTPWIVKNFDWTPNDPAHSYMRNAMAEDLTFLIQDYEHTTDRYKIPFDNWESSSEKWNRFTDVQPKVNMLQAEEFCSRRSREVKKTKGHIWTVKNRTSYGK